MATEADRQMYSLQIVAGQKRQLLGAYGREEAGLLRSIQ